MRARRLVWRLEERRDILVVAPDDDTDARATELHGNQPEVVERGPHGEDRPLAEEIDSPLPEISRSRDTQWAVRDKETKGAPHLGALRGYVGSDADGPLCAVYLFTATGKKGRPVRQRR